MKRKHWLIPAILLAITAVLACAASMNAPSATTSAVIAGAPPGMISGRVMVVSETGRRPYERTATVQCRGQTGSTVYSTPGTGAYRCSAIPGQNYRIFAKGHPYAPGATTVSASAGGVDVELSEFNRSVGDTVALPESAYERRVRNASSEERQLMCEAARWAQDETAARVAC